MWLLDRKQLAERTDHYPLIEYFEFGGVTATTAKACSRFWEWSKYFTNKATDEDGTNCRCTVFREWSKYFTNKATDEVSTNCRCAVFIFFVVIIFFDFGVGGQFE